jgi:hypothetical protein
MRFVVAIVAIVIGVGADPHRPRQRPYPHLGGDRRASAREHARGRQQHLHRWEGRHPGLRADGDRGGGDPVRDRVPVHRSEQLSSVCGAFLLAGALL